MSNPPNAPSRNIVIFCDGTWNSPEEEAFGQPTATNVHKLFMACEDEATSKGDQLTWYQRGVGSDGAWYRRAFEGATGTGTGESIRRGYAAIAARYRPGDRVFLVGFSRGAFTARSIAGMIEKTGLVRDPSRRCVAEAYRLYRRDRRTPSKRGRLASDAIEAYRTSTAVHPDARIHAIGVWDTVGALGLSMWGWCFNVLWIRNDFHRLSANRITDRVHHAMALDEKRSSFVPVPWKDADDRGPVVEEAWFRGVHSDVGGGYADARLSDITLAWMASRLAEAGLLLRPNLPRVAPDCTGRIHNSARGPLWTKVATWPRWTPQRTAAELNQARPRSSLHESVAERERRAVEAGLVEKARRRLAIGETMRVAVHASQPWEYTGLVLEPGATYRLCAAGSWQDGGDSPVGPAGQPEEDESLLKRLTRRSKRMRDARWFALVAVPCHDFGWRWREFGARMALRYLLWEDPAEFTSQYVRVGGGIELIGPERNEAMLWCFANDANRFYGGNTGSVVLEIERRGEAG